MSYNCTVIDVQPEKVIIDMSTTPKRRAVCSYENMSEELAAAFAEKYPKGYSDNFPDLVKYDKPDGTNFYAVTVEIPDAIYLVKIKVKTDDADGNDGESLPDDNISQYSNGDDDGADGEYSKVQITICRPVFPGRLFFAFFFELTIFACSVLKHA